MEYNGRIFMTDRNAKGSSDDILCTFPTSEIRDSFQDLTNAKRVSTTSRLSFDAVRFRQQIACILYFLNYG
jgi:hypothetical protein